jgi:hypothetical protein
MGENICQKNINAYSVSQGKKPGKEVLPGRSEFPRPLAPYFGKMILDFALI